MAADTAIEPVQVIPRAMERTDEEFIVDSWRKSWRNAPGAKHLSNEEYAARFEELVLLGLLGSERAQVMIAADAKAQGDIVGWICHTTAADAGRPSPTVHYVYVRHKTRRTKQPARRSGLLAAMLSIVGVRDRLIYTFRPSERAHPRDDRQPIEQYLLAAAERAGIACAYEPIRSWLGREDPKDKDD